MKNQLSPSVLFTIVILAVLALYSNCAHTEAKYPFIEYCKYYKYPVEEHFVKTEDGYILRMFRIQKRGTEIRAGLQPIILQHGLLDSSDTFLINDEDKAPGFMLANQGYDIWFGNNRGNKHSRNHTTLNPDKDAKFWEFTFQHMADYDLPNFFKYVNLKTNASKIHYIGHSQGSMQMHVALSKRNPTVETFLGKYFAFGPVAFVKYATSHVVTLLNDSPILEWYKIRGIHEFMPSFGWFTTDAGVIFCSTFPKVCGDIMKQIMDADPSQDNYDRYDVLVGHAPAGTSVLNMRHWKQLFNSGKFQAYDYGSARDNEIAYGTPYPPTWDLGQIRQPMRLIAGNSDELADLTDVNALWDFLKPEVKTFLRVYNAGHCTFMWGINVAPWMNDVKSMLRAN